MSIIGKERERKMGYNPYSSRNKKDDSVKTEAPKILDLQVLRNYVPKVLDFMKPEMKPSYEKYRKHTYLWQVPIHHILGKINEPTWVFMIENTAKWVIESYEAIQPNGRWHIYDYEIKRETRNHPTNRSVGRNKDGTADTMEIVEAFEFLVVGIQIVDVSGGRDLVYDMGRPTTQKDTIVNVSSDNDKRISQQESQLEEQRKEIFELKKDLNKQNELMTALLSELQSQKITPPKKRTARK